MWLRTSTFEQRAQNTRATGHKDVSRNGDDRQHDSSIGCVLMASCMASAISYFAASKAFLFTGVNGSPINEPFESTVAKIFFIAFSSKLIRVSIAPPPL